MLYGDVEYFRHQPCSAELAGVPRGLPLPRYSADGCGADALASGVHALGGFGEFGSGQPGRFHGGSEWLTFALAEQFGHADLVPFGGLATLVCAATPVLQLQLQGRQVCVRVFRELVP